jgi:hypothetical protein
MEDFENRPLFFVYAPPLKGTRPSKRNDLQPPYRDAPPWECSVYYWWWEYLRRHEGYKKTCEKNGKGKYSKLYKDFGDVHATEFWEWWKKHPHLFAEPKVRQVEVVEQISKDPTVLTVQIPLENKQSLSMRQLKRLLEPKLKLTKQRKTESKALYPVATKPVLSSLYTHLKVWDAKHVNPGLDDVEIADIADVPIDRIVDGFTADTVPKNTAAFERFQKVIRRRKQLAVQRHFRIASQYIENVGLGKFPVRNSR